MAHYPPSPPSLRWVFAGLRGFSTVVLAFVAWIGIDLVQGGDTLAALRYVAGAASFAAATWVSPYSIAFLVFLGLPILILPVSSGSGVIFTLIGKRSNRLTTNRSVRVCAHGVSVNPHRTV